MSPEAPIEPATPIVAIVILAYIFIGIIAAIVVVIAKQRSHTWRDDDVALSIMGSIVTLLVVPMIWPLILVAGFIHWATKDGE